MAVEWSNKCSSSARYAQEDVQLEIAELGSFNPGLQRMSIGSLVDREKK